MQREMKGQRNDMNLRAVKQERELKRKRTSKACLPIAQIDFSQSITSSEEEGNRNKGNEEAFSSDQSPITVTEGEEIGPKTPSAKPSSLTTCFRQADIKLRVRTFHWYWRYSSLLLRATIYGNTNCCIRARLLTCLSANTVAQQISRVHYCTYET